MKKIFLLLGLLLTVTLTAQEVSKTYYFANPQVVNHEGYVLVEFPGAMQSAVLGNPMLPYTAASILLPPGCEASDVELEFGKLIPISAKGEVFPKQPVRPVSATQITEFYKNEDVYNSKAAYPAKAEGQLTTGFYRGYSIANVAFTPVVYIPSDNSLAYYSSVTVKVTPKETAKAANALTLLKKTDDIYQKVDNSEAVAKYSYLIPATKDADDYEILIISAASYQPKFDTLISMYFNYGLFSQFKPLAEIYNEMEGRDNQEKIRNYIIQEYTNHSIEYVVIGGDVDVFPYRGFYCTVTSSSFYEDYGIPADIYYAGLDGTWNENNNNKWAEIGEDDLYLEVAVSRMPFSNNNDIDHMIHKITSYQLHPVWGELDNPSLLGEWMYDNPQTYGSDFLRLLVGDHDDNGYTTHGIPTDNVIDTLYAEYESFTKAKVIANINAGASFVHHAGHANQWFVMELNDSDVTDANFNNVNGVTHNYTFVYTHGCDCGSFDYNDCIAEKMVTISNFAVGGCFNTRYGWFNEGQTEGPSGHLNREFVDAMYHDKLSRYGMAQKESKNATVPWVSAPGQWEEGALRWCFYDCNALADPVTQIWIEDPYTLTVGHTSFIDNQATTFHVTVYNASKDNFETNARCVLMNGNQFLGRGITNEDGECDIEIVGELPEFGQLQLKVSSYNTVVNNFRVNVGGSNLKGDANEDGGVSVLDILAAISYIKGDNPQPFNFTLADVNEDGQINVLDIVGIVNIIFGSYDMENCEQSTATYFIENGILYIDTPVKIGGIQLVFNDSVFPVEGSFSDLEIVTNSLGTGKFMFMAYGQEGETLPVGKYALVNVNDADLSKIVISDKYGCVIEPIYAPVGIEDIEIQQLNSISPNPFNQSQSISYNINSNVNTVNFVVTNINGQVVDRFEGTANFGDNTITWTPQNLNNGMYFVNMYVDGARVSTDKVIYQK